MNPPRLTPSTCALSIPAASSTAIASAAIIGTEYGPSGTSLSPTPRLSKTSTRKSSASSPGSGPKPCRS